MSNPLMGMAQGMMSGGNNMFAQIRQFAGLIGNRNPQRMAMNLAKQKGVSDQQMQELIQQAQQIARQMGGGM